MTSRLPAPEISGIKWYYTALVLVGEPLFMISLGLNILRLLKAICGSWSIPGFRAGFVLAMLILLSGTVFYRSVEGWSWTDALYFSATTVSTVGLGDLSPQTDLGKLFTVVYIFVGVGVFVLLFAQFARALTHVENATAKENETEIKE